MLFGIMVLLVGLMFLLQNLGVIQGSVWAVFWPVLLIVFGLGIMASRKRHCWFCGGHHGRNKEEWHKFGDEMREKFGHHHHEHNDEHKKEDEPGQN